jgi:hypothetical protein
VVPPRVNPSLGRLALPRGRPADLVVTWRGLDLRGTIRSGCRPDGARWCDGSTWTFQLVQARAYARMEGVHCGIARPVQLTRGESQGAKGGAGSGYWWVVTRLGGWIAAPAVRRRRVTGHDREEVARLLEFDDCWRTLKNPC